ncbi:MAG: ABC transporter substrate-binding protein [Ilumatobacteraceae bacterium]
MGIRVTAVAVAFVLLAAACGKDREESVATTAATSVAETTTIAPVDTSSATTAGSTDSTTGDSAAATTVDTTPATEAPPALPSFGNAPWPCSEGDGANSDSGSEPGVTTDSIRIATGDDAGYAGSPGLNHEMTDTMKAFVAACNELGGINGRQVQLDYYDAKLFEVAGAIQGACDAGTFFLVGEGWAFDSNQEEIRLGCGLPAVPTYAVSAAFAHGKDVFVGVPNPSDETTAGWFAQVAKLFPDDVTAAGTLAGGFSATQESRDKVVAVAPQFGWKFASSTIEYNPAGEADWTPFVKQLQDAGAKLVYWSGTCLPGLQLFAQAAIANGYNVPIITDANHYSRQCADANTDGALDNMYVRVASIPFEEAALNPATQQFIDTITNSGGDISLLGTQTASSFLLWATAASACGNELTRACTLENLKNTHQWTGHGLHAETDPGGNHPAKCNIMLHLVGSTYERVVPKEPGTFECNDSWVAKVGNTPAVVAAKLDENRISQQFATG